MSIPKRTSVPGTSFITTATQGRRRIFQKEENAKLFIETLQHYRSEGFYKLHAFVVMPEHVHLLLTPQSITLERVMSLIKGGFSHQLASKITPWQKLHRSPHPRPRRLPDQARIYPPESGDETYRHFARAISILVSL